MDRLVRLEEIQRKAEPFYRLDGMTVSKGDPEESGHVNHIGWVVKEKLLVPMRMPVLFD